MLGGPQMQGHIQKVFKPFNSSRFPLQGSVGLPRNKKELLLQSDWSFSGGMIWVRARPHLAWNICLIQALTSCGTGNLGVSVPANQCNASCSSVSSLPLFLRHKVLLYALLAARPTFLKRIHVLPQPYGFCT